MACADLQPGMFVAELDRCWLQTPYPPGGFLLRSFEQLRELQRHCAHVYVDPARGAAGADAGRHAPSASVPPAADRLAGIQAELQALAEGVEAVFRAGRDGDELPVARLAGPAGPVLASLRSAPDDVLWLLGTGLDIPHLPRRALGTGILLGFFGQRLGHSPRDTLDLLLAGLLLDVGKLAVPVTILAKPGRLNDSEHAFIRRHVRRGLYLARTAPDLPPAVEDAIIGHHERLDGSGYPRGCRSADIPTVARMAAIVDSYDALTLERRYAHALPAQRALGLLDGQSRTKFDAALLQFFTHIVGIWPTGSWVQLADGRIGIVRAQTVDEPRRPRVALVSDSAGRPLPVTGQLWSPLRRGDILRGLAPGHFRLPRSIVGPALTAAALAA
jgi:hypothetical protein